MTFTTFSPSSIQKDAIAIAATAYELCFQLNEMPVAFGGSVENSPVQQSATLATSTLATALHDEECATYVNDSVMRLGEYSESQILQFIREYKATQPMKLYIAVNAHTSEPSPIFCRDAPRMPGQPNTKVFGPFECGALSALQMAVEEFRSTTGDLGTLPQSAIDRARDALGLDRLPVTSEVR